MPLVNINEAHVRPLSSECCDGPVCSYGSHIFVESPQRLPSTWTIVAFCFNCWFLVFAAGLSLTPILTRVKKTGYSMENTGKVTGRGVRASINLWNTCMALSYVTGVLREKIGVTGWNIVVLSLSKPLLLLADMRVYCGLKLQGAWLNQHSAPYVLFGKQRVQFSSTWSLHDIIKVAAVELLLLSGYVCH